VTTYFGLYRISDGVLLRFGKSTTAQVPADGEAIIGLDERLHPEKHYRVVDGVLTEETAPE
jgi:hypothetical protein